LYEQGVSFKVKKIISKVEWYKKNSVILLPLLLSITKV
jgi:hypothetical protein